jgi:hypothetical protein
MSNKKVFQARISSESIELLKKIAEINKRNIGNTLELIIEKAAKENGII